MPNYQCSWCWEYLGETHWFCHPRIEAFAYPKSLVYSGNLIKSKPPVLPTRLVTIAALLRTVTVTCLISLLLRNCLSYLRTQNTDAAWMACSIGHCPSLSLSLYSFILYRPHSIETWLQGLIVFSCSHLPCSRLSRRCLTPLCLSSSRFSCSCARSFCSFTYFFLLSQLLCKAFLQLLLLQPLPLQFLSLQPLSL
jgi:hypothetical protein